jgi:hypothetical protein
VFHRDQAPRIYETLKRWAPTATGRQKEDHVRELIVTRYSAVFAALTGGDFVALGSTLMGVADHCESEAKKGGWPLIVNTEHLRTRGQALRDGGRHHINQTLAALFQGAPKPSRGGADSPAGGAGAGGAGASAADATGALKDLVEAPWLPAGSLVLAEAFSDRLVAGGDFDDKRVSEVWRTGNPARYSGRFYKDFPSWARTEEFVPNLGPLKLTDVVENGPLPPTSFSAVNARRDEIADELKRDLDPEPLGRSEAWLRSSPV